MKREAYPRIIENENGKFAICRVSRGKFMIAKWNPHHQNWVRDNRREGRAVHRSLDVIATDNLGGGPVEMTLAAALSEIENG